MNQMSLFDLPVPSMPVLDVSRCYSKPVNYQTAAKMVEEFHYAHRVPSIVLAIGMYVDDVLAGVCCYGVPANSNLMDLCGTENRNKVLELNRLFIHEWAGHNSESWLIGQSFKWLEKTRKDIQVLVSYADTAQNHQGMIYRATNWLYTGMNEPGGSQNIYINGVKHSKKDIYNQFGTCDFNYIVGLYPDATQEERSNKHRYVMFLGDKRTKQALRKALKYPVLPYPKANES